ncbi:hypothetical protein L7F22_000739 [Adiantum nelumboides]|nr:hypothetical protein [Adiantum nelumboides]
MRVYRECSAIEKRGVRDTGKGRRLDFLTTKELKNAALDSRKELKEAKRKLWWLKAKVVMYSVRIRSLKEANFECINRKDVRRFCNNIVEAHRRGKFGGNLALWNFFQDVAKNVLRPKKGQRFTESTKTMFEIIKLWGGPRLHDFLSANLGGPSISTTKRQAKKVTHFKGGEHGYIFDAIGKIYMDAKIKNGVTARVPIIIVKDETTIKRHIRWNAKDDTLIGFCGSKEENHQCCSNDEVIVGDGSAGYDKVVDAFQTHWNLVETMWNAKFKETIGPIIGHASNGDSRRRKLMFEDYLGKNDTPFFIEWCGWKLRGSDAAEIYFSKIGGMVGQERAFDFGDMLHSVGSLNKIAMHECISDGLTFSRAHKKQEHIWKELNKHEGVAEANLGDYESVSTDAKLIDALKEELQNSQALCNSLGLKPTKAEDLKWWEQPWVDSESTWS